MRKYTHTREPRIRWHQEEVVLFIEECARLVMTRSSIPWTVQALADQGQLVLPKDRHLRSYTQARRRMVKDAMALAARRTKQFEDAKQAAKVEAETPPPSIAPSVAPPSEPESAPIYIPVPTAPNLSAVTLTDLVVECARRLAEYLQTPALGELREFVSSAIPRPVSIQAPQTKPSPELAPPKVGVVGLFLDQFKHVKSRVNGKKAELVFIDKDRAAQGSSFPALDYVVVQRHSRHSFYNNARAEFGNEKVKFVDGGISACTRAVAEFIPGCLNGLSI